MKTHVLVRWGELFLKSPQVKKHMQLLLSNNIRKKLIRNGVEPKLNLTRDRIIIESDNAGEAAAYASEVFGVQSTSPAVKIPADKENVLAETAE
ncbi:MAG: hypothetical protein GF334_04395, partial [Candidatus Altiarchaeales archaeon]|nr:hypothetical protein [Candidatus Altiarchaeales archaeon]